MNRMIRSTLALALAAAFVSPALAEGPIEMSYGKASNIVFKAQEGASGLALFNVARKGVDASSSWSQIRRQALPDWPTIAFPNGMAYILPSLCHDGGYLFVKGKSTDEVCAEPNGEVCGRTRTVSLVVPIEYSSKQCTNLVPVQGGRPGESAEYQYTEWRCMGSWERVPARHQLTHLVDVRTPPQQNGEIADPNSGKLLFQKEYTIEACR